MTLGSKRMDEMRAKAGYNPVNMKSHIRAAGEEIQLQAHNEFEGGVQPTYTVADAKKLLSPDQWKMLGEMVEIPAGAFLMGTNDPRSNDANKPEHSVTLHAYRIDKYPVTQAQYARFVVAQHYRLPLNWEGGHLPAGRELHPVNLVSWNNARDYCTWKGKQLPTEAEWEKAARGTDGRRWPWGNNLNRKYLNTYYSARHTTPVTAYPKGASPYGVMDMAGNVSEWTATMFAPYPGSNVDSATLHPQQLDTRYHQSSDKVERSEYRVRRGGSWKSDPFATASYHRNYSLPNYASDFFGFRCASEEP
ncbi:MAG: SUMF1/EgtB/PvdO family nonheme iron enzyme [Mariprofundales bacterium]|nr:SUMF1/EgtB/PvdO family nonheme iron enzyme [Mariprofundales bacterium]